MIQKNWSQIAKMALDALAFTIDYCDMTPLCDDCILHNPDKDCCMLKADNLIELDKFIKERRNETN